MNKYTEADVIRAANVIADFCRLHICTQCPLNLAKKHDSILNAVCLCDNSINIMPSNWNTDELNKGGERRCG